MDLYRIVTMFSIVGAVTIIVTGGNAMFAVTVAMVGSASLLRRYMTRGLSGKASQAGILTLAFCLLVLVASGVIS